MQWDQILSALILIFLGWMQTSQTLYRKRTEKRAECRAQESFLQMTAQASVCKLSVLTAKKVTGGEVNGDLEKAMEKAEETQKDYGDYITKLAAEQATKV